MSETFGEVYGLIKTQKFDNPVRIITRGCNTAVKSLPIYVGKMVVDITSNLASRMKDTVHIFDK